MLLKVDNEKACFDYCQSRTDCNWFTFLPRNGFCELFKNCVVLGLDYYHSFNSGPKNCLEIKSKCGFQGECKGITVEHEQTKPTLKDCFYLCSITPGVNFINILRAHFCYVSAFLVLKYHTKALRSAKFSTKNARIKC
jgi:hypothetical protein